MLNKNNSQQSLLQNQKILSPVSPQTFQLGSAYASTKNTIETPSTGLMPQFSLNQQQKQQKEDRAESDGVTKGINIGSGPVKANQFFGEILSQNK